MSLSQLLQSRYSVRAFQPKPVAEETLKEILDTAQCSASNCNTQPWEPILVTGDKLKELEGNLMKAVMTGNPPNPDFNWNVKYEGVHRDRQWGSAMALYGAMGIERDDKQARMLAMGRNWQFFGAPHAILFTMDKYLDIMGAVDIGIYAQTLSLLLQEKGISSCMQGALGQYPIPIREMFDLPESRGVLFGMSFGYEDKEHPANTARTDRERTEDVVTVAS